MKTLLESIFGDKSSIISDTEKSLWDGYDKSTKISKSNKFVEWTPTNKNNILTTHYGPSAYKLIIHRYSLYSLELAIEFEEGTPRIRLSTCIALPIAARRNISKKNICVDEIKEIFKSRPDILNIEGRYISSNEDRGAAILWKDFKKKYKLIK